MLQCASSGPQSRAPSVYGGAGGFGTCISWRSSSFYSSSSGSMTTDSKCPVINGGKITMQNLNDRLASYLEKLSQYQSIITTLETELQNMKASLEQLQIKYTVLLELKPRLESEIAEYRRLLEGEAYEQKK
ncbi:hypothetical protein XENOCAPTIV_002900 [Xenoophorus captivus]|uniref:IF rod domain-containing protein n=1 Tax=Xenoophorus captivus TaxID=1517983 RepID=A0ABV0QPJ4_9TELE